NFSLKKFSTTRSRTAPLASEICAPTGDGEEMTERDKKGKKKTGSCDLVVSLLRRGCLQHDHCSGPVQP
uniref:Uncharacterized protein n=1 Tax=Seriola dumerili TaxID=41447 RepID=A0A3B4US59_SERDU